MMPLSTTPSPLLTAEYVEFDHLHEHVNCQDLDSMEQHCEEGPVIVTMASSLFYFADLLKEKTFHQPWLRDDLGRRGGNRKSAARR